MARGLSGKIHTTALQYTVRTVCKGIVASSNLIRGKKGELIQLIDNIRSR